MVKQNEEKRLNRVMAKLADTAQTAIAITFLIIDAIGQKFAFFYT